MTARQLIYRGCRLLGYSLPGMTLPRDIENDGRDALNDLLASLQTESLAIYSIREDIFTLTINVQSYTIGPSGATFTALRPMFIKDANLILQQQTPVVRSPLEILRDSSQWASIQVRAIPNSLPSKLYYNPTVPNGTINLWPGPLLAYQLELFTWSQLAAFADLTTDYSLPPGYESTLTYGLAVALAPMIPDKLKQGRLDLVINEARRYKAVLKSHNAAPQRLSSDVPLMSGDQMRSDFNYDTGNLTA